MPVGSGRIKAGEGSLIGNAGEFYVVAELLKRGVIAALVPRNTPAVDVLAKVRNGLRGLGLIELEGDRAETGMQFDHKFE